MRYENRNNYPFYIVEWLKHDEYDYEPGVLSATRLIAPVRQTVLLERYAEQLSCDVADLIAKRYGTAIHASFEKMQDKYKELGYNVVQEKRLYATVGGHRISGKADLFYLTDYTYDSSVYKLADIKSTSAWSYVNGSNMDNYILQLSILSYLMLQNGYAISPIAEVAYVFTDWKRADTFKGQDYPKERILVKDIELMDPETVYDWIVARIALIEHYRTVETEKLLECTREDLWVEPTRYAVMKSTNKRAVRVFDDREEASQFLKGKERDHRIEIRKGGARRCGYCDARSVCFQYSEMKARGEVE